MNILQIAIYNELLDIEAENAMANREPSHALLIRDKVHERVEKRLGYELAWSEFYKALQMLDLECKIRLGDTIRDQYAAIVYKDFNSSL
jgi:hypothetical protein